MGPAGTKARCVYFSQALTIPLLGERVVYYNRFKSYVFKNSTVVFSNKYIFLYFEKQSGTKTKLNFNFDSYELIKLNSEIFQSVFI